MSAFLFGGATALLLFGVFLMLVGPIPRSQESVYYRGFDEGLVGSGLLMAITAVALFIATSLAWLFS